MKTIQGNLIHLAQNGEFDLIVHGRNCFRTMGAGNAKGIKAAFPESTRRILRLNAGNEPSWASAPSLNSIRTALR